MADYTKYNSFVEYLMNKEMDLFGTTDTVKAAIHSDAPIAASDTTLANLTEISGTGYTAGGIDIQNDATRTTATVTMFTTGGFDPVWTAGAGGFSAGQYVSIYDDTPTTPTADILIASWDYGSSFTVANLETFTLDFGASVLTLA